MPLPQRINCEYCNASNVSKAKQCIACGAPLPDKLPPTPTSHTVYRHKPSPLIASPKDIETARKVGEKADKIFWTGAYLYSAFWRALAETITIAVVGFATGFLGGATGMPIGGVIGAVLIGLSIGMAIKYPILTYISAPAGFITGAALCVLLWLLKFPPQGMVFITTLFAVIAALLGRIKTPFSRRLVWEKIRPFLGTLGGLIIGLVGMLVGLGLRAALMAFLESI